MEGQVCRIFVYLQSFIHISTSFSNWFELDIEEKFYQTTYDPHVVIKLCETFPDDTLDKVRRNF